MSLLDICQNIARAVPTDVPLTVIGNSAANLLLSQANLAGEQLARKPQGGWISMIREFTFTTAAIAVQAGTVANSGAGGVAVITGLASTAGITANIWGASGTGIKDNSIITAVAPTTVTLNQPAAKTGAGTFIFGQSDYPLPSDYERPVDGTFWDRARYWSLRGPMSPQKWQMYKSSMIGKASVQRRYRFRNISGTTYLSLDPIPLTGGDTIVFEYVSNGWCKSIGGAYQTKWTTDTDVGVLDEYLIQLGALWRVLKRMGMAYDAEKDEYDREVAKAISADGGAPVLSLATSSDTFLLGPYNIPESNFGGVTG